MSENGRLVDQIGIAMAVAENSATEARKRIETHEDRIYALEAQVATLRKTVLETLELLKSLTHPRVAP